MTNEQREAIEYIQKQIDYFKEQIKFIEAVDCDYYEEEYELYKNRIKQFSTVLSLIKEQQEEIEKKDKQIDLIKEYTHQEIVHYTETIKDYIDDDKEGNKHYIEELKEKREHWRDVEKLLQNKPKEELYMNWWKYGLYE